MFNRLLSFLIIFSLNTSFAAETCSRIAIINYQEVLVDAGSSKKGDGLRFYLEKDPRAIELLDEYQEENKPSVWNAAASTIGTFMAFSGLIQTNEDSGIENRNTLIYGGALLIALSYLTSKTIQFNNEVILKRSVDQYNKRNLPRIYFSPQAGNGGSGVGIGIQQEF